MSHYVLYISLRDTHFYYTSITVKQFDDIVKANGSFVSRDPALKFISWILV